MGIETILGMGMFILKEAPDVIDFIKGLKDNGQDKPTQQQMDEFNQARRERGLEDVRWDNFIAG